MPEYARVLPWDTWIFHEQFRTYEGQPYFNANYYSDPSKLGWRWRTSPVTGHIDPFCLWRLWRVHGTLGKGATKSIWGRECRWMQETEVLRLVTVTIKFGPPASCPSKKSNSGKHRAHPITLKHQPLLRETCDAKLRYHAPNLHPPSPTCDRNCWGHELLMLGGLQFLTPAGTSAQYSQLFLGK